ncbi:MAG: tetratricopeptide repeat protein, partial [Myxococcota bacterium]
EALHRAAAKLYLASGDHQEALEAVRSCTNPLAYRTMAEAARRSKHEQLRIQALQSLCNDTISTERALAFLSLSEAYAEQNRLDEAQSALKEAASADRALSLIRVAQEMLVRRRGEHPHFGETKLETSTSAIVSAAKSAMEPNAHIEERSLLTQAAQQGSLTADTITLDAATEHRDIEAMVEALERVSAQGDLSQRAGPVLTKAGLLESLGRSSETIKLLRATETSQLSASLLRYSLARRVMDRDPKDAALIWQEESENQTGHSAAAAATMTGRLLHRLGEDARSMFRRATQASAQYRPAIWNLEDIFRKEGQLEEAARIQRDLAGSEKTSFACTRLVRAAIRLSESPEKARFALEEALTLSPLDPILRSLRSKHSLPDPLQDEADYLQQIASELSPDFSRSAKLRAALLFSNTGNLENAEKIYQELLSDSPEDPFALIALDRIELVNDKLTNAANRRMTAAKNAISVEEQITTLEELADFEQHERNDTSSAILARQALLEVSPGHIPSLRCIERYLMRMNRLEDLVSIEASLAEHLTDATDAAAHARLAIRLMTRDQTKAIPIRRIDPLIFRVREALHELPWVARMWLTVGGSTLVRKSAELDKKTELIAEARHALEDSFASPLEKATAKIRTAEALLAAGKSDEAVLKVLEAARQQPDHLFVHEYSARILLASGAFEEATNHFEKASELSKSDRRRTELLYEVARVHADHLNDPTSSLAALERVVRADVTYRDTFERTKAIFLSRGDSDGLLELISQRIRAGGPAEELIALDLDHAGISAKIGALKSAKQSLKHALSLKPNHKEVLQRLSEVCCADEDWRGAAEALIKMARQASDRTELKQLFFRLGELYDTHLPEPKRAEAAYLRVLKTAPSDLDTLDRLATLYRREGEFQKACEMLTDLTQIVSDPERNRDYRIAFAECLEELGDLKRAEATLEQTRRSAPLDLHVLKTITRFYERHDDTSALGMHLSRSLKEFQRAVDINAVDRSSW